MNTIVIVKVIATAVIIHATVTITRATRVTKKYVLYLLY